MDWGDLAKQVISLGAPMLGTALGGPLGGVAGEILAKAVGSVSITPAAVQTVISPSFFDTQNTYTVNAGLNYSMTPFLSAALSASYTERVASHTITPQDIVTVSLNYRPY